MRDQSLGGREETSGRGAQCWVPAACQGEARRARMSRLLMSSALQMEMRSALVKGEAEGALTSASSTG